MMASQRLHTKRHLALLGLALAIALAATTPAPTFAKTRPPIEAGDPDIGNEKPRNHSQASSLLIDQQARSEKLLVYNWLRELTYASYLVRTLYRFY